MLHSPWHFWTSDFLAAFGRAFSCVHVETQQLDKSFLHLQCSSSFSNRHLFNTRVACCYVYDDTLPYDDSAALPWAVPPWEVVAVPMGFPVSRLFDQVLDIDHVEVECSHRAAGFGGACIGFGFGGAAGGHVACVGVVLSGAGTVFGLGDDGKAAYPGRGCWP